MDQETLVYVDLNGDEDDATASLQLAIAMAGYFELDNKRAKAIASLHKRYSLATWVTGGNDTETRD